MNEGLRMHVIENAGEWEVWVSLPDTTEPEKSTEAFIIGTGATRVKALRGALGALAVSTGKIAEAIREHQRLPNV